MLQWISVALENSVKGVSCPDNKQYTLLILSEHGTLSTEFSNATAIKGGVGPVLISPIPWDISLYCRTAFQLRWPVILMICCSSIPFWNSLVVHVLRREWLVK